MRKYHYIKINLPGGIVAAGDLHAWMEAAERCGVDQVQFGNRQHLFCRADSSSENEFRKELDQLGVVYEVNRNEYANILTSYVAEDVFQNSNWLSEGVYKDILGLFDYRPRLKLNLVDANQSFIPFFTGNINFISSPVSNYWYLYVRFPKTTIIYCWKGLIYSDDIPRMTRLVEEAIIENKTLTDGDALYDMVHAKEQFITQPVTAELSIPKFVLPYYEGFNRYGEKSWLGIYRRDECFPVSFLKDIASLCLKTKVGQLYVTPWKSLIVKGIEQKDRAAWDFVLNTYRINVRHAANELNWQVEDLNEEGLNLKRYIIRQFDKDDVRTYGLSFAIKTKSKSGLFGLFGAVVIAKQDNTSRNKSAAMNRYDIMYTKDFNPNSREYILFRKGVQKEELGAYLISLCKYFYDLAIEADKILHSVYRQEVVQEPTAKAPANMPVIYKCKHCFTVYDEHYGDSENNVAPGTPFSQLPDAYHCPVCESSKSEFQAVKSEGVKS
jgi:rubredoxin